MATRFNGLKIIRRKLEQKQTNKLYEKEQKLFHKHKQLQEAEEEEEATAIHTENPMESLQFATTEAAG